MIKIDYSNMMATAVEDGISPEEWSQAAPAFKAAHTAVTQLRTNRTIGFFDLSDDLLRQSTQYAAEHRGRYDDVVLLGIGGSALGPIALREALRPNAWNELASK